MATGSTLALPGVTSADDINVLGRQRTGPVAGAPGTVSVVGGGRPHGPVSELTKQVPPVRNRPRAPAGGTTKAQVTCNRTGNLGLSRSQEGEGEASSHLRAAFPVGIGRPVPPDLLADVGGRRADLATAHNPPPPPSGGVMSPMPGVRRPDVEVEGRPSFNAPRPSFTDEFTAFLSFEYQLQNSGSLPRRLQT